MARAVREDLAELRGRSITASSRAKGKRYVRDWAPFLMAQHCSGQSRKKKSAPSIKPMSLRMVPSKFDRKGSKT